jgi:signal transduction histidine kinase
MSGPEKAHDTIKELEAQLASAPDVERKVDILNALARELRHSDLSRAVALAKAAAELASQDGREPYQAGLADSHYYLGDFSIRMGSYDRALSHLSKALALYEARGDSRRGADVLHHIGDTWAHLGNYSDALHYFFRLRGIYREMGLKTEEAAVLSNIGNTYWYLQDSKKALAYLHMSLQISQETGDKKEQADALVNSCSAYCRLGEYQKALNCGLASIQFYEELGDRRGVAEGANSVGEVYQALRDDSHALTCYRKALQISQEMGLRYEAAWVLQKIGGVYLDRGQPDKALSYIQQALRIGQEINSRQRLLESHQVLARIYRETGDLEKALAHLEQSYTLKEELFSEEADERAKRLEVMHQVETARKEAEISQLRNVDLEREITERKQAEEALQITNAQLQLEIEERERLIADLDAFAHTVAHDLKTPVSIIAGHSTLLLDDRTDMAGAQTREFIRLIEQTAYRMGQIIDEILFLASVRQREIIPHRLDTQGIVREAEKRLAPMIAEHRANIRKPTSWPEAWGHASWVEEVWVNYIGNAIKYGGNPPQIELGATPEDNGRVRFWIHDNGDGLSQKAQARLFSAFTRLDETKSQGHGLGLSIVKRIVEKLGGEVAVESAGIPGQGSTFSFTLPARKGK